MGLSPRAYFTIEQDPAAVNDRHVRLAEIVAIELAVERADASLAPPRIADLARRFGALARHERATNR